jgi:SulP family sulfate permease
MELVRGRPLLARRSVLPIVHWLPHYSLADLRPDVLAGLTVAAFTLPEALAYGSLAGLPPVVGIYACAAAALVYGLFGSSRQLVVGATSALSVLIAGTLASAAHSTTEYVALAGETALLVAGIALIASLLRLGFVENFISESVLVGFSTGAGLYVASTQLAPLLGLTGASGNFFQRIGFALRHLADVDPASLALGAATIALVLGGRRLAPRLPWSLMVVAGAIALSSAVDLAAHGVLLVGSIPGGLPPLGLPDATISHVPRIGTLAVACFLLSFVEGVAAARTFAERHGQRIDADQELIGVAATNLAAGLAQGMPVGGSISRTSVADQADVRTPLASIAAGALLLLVLAFATAPFERLPEPVLAGIVIAAVVSLVNVPALLRIRRLSGRDFASALTTLAGVLVFGMLDGILIGIAFSLLTLIERVSFPRLVLLGRVPGTEHYADVARHPENIQIPGVLLFRIDGPLFFASAEAVREDLENAVRRQEQPVRLVVINLEATPIVDLASADMLHALRRELAERGATLRLAGASGEVRDSLRREGLADDLGRIGQLTTVESVVREWLAEAHHGAEAAPTG